MWFFFFKSFNVGCLTGIDGPEDMKRICGTIVARRRGRRGKEDKVSEEKQKPLTVSVWK